MNARFLLRRLVVLALGCTATAAPAATISWNGGSGTWDGATTTAWSTGTVPTSGDDVVFNASGVNTADVITQSGAVSANSLTFNTTGAVTFSGGSTSNYIKLGAGGITVSSGVPSFTLGAVAVEASQTWSNLSANTVTLSSMVADGNAGGPVTLTLSGGIWNSGGTYNVLNDNGSGKALSLVLAGGANLTLQKTDTYSGTTTIKSGSLTLKQSAGSSSSTAYGGAGNGALYLGDASASTSATLSLQFSGYFNNALTTQGTGTDTISLGSASATVTNTGAITLNNTLTLTSSTTGTTFYATGAISGGGGVSLVSSSGKTTTAVLGAANTYTGANTVSAGTLLVSNTTGSGTGTGAVTVASGATFGGTGIVAPTGANGVTVSSGGIVSPGGVSSVAIGTLTLDGGGTTGALLTMASGAKFAFDLGASDTSDAIKFLNYAAGDLALNSTAFTFTGAQAGTYLLFQFYSDSGTTLTSSGLTASSFNLAGSTGLTGYNAALDFSTTGDIYLDVTAVPEPDALALLGGGLILGGFGWMRRRAAATA